jgi:hypothetical protein
MQQLAATDTAPDRLMRRQCLMRRHRQIESKRSALRTRLLQPLVAPLVPNSATPTFMASPIDAAVKAKRSDIIHLDATPASRKPAADAATHIRLLLEFNVKPESEACRIQSLQLQLERMQP